jgi:hypothetical protein
MIRLAGHDLLENRARLQQIGVRLVGRRWAAAIDTVNIDLGVVH